MKLIDLELNSTHVLAGRLHAAAMVELPNEEGTYYLPFRGEESEYVVLFNPMSFTLSCVKGSFGDLMWLYTKGEKPKVIAQQFIDTPDRADKVKAVTSFLTKFGFISPF